MTNPIDSLDDDLTHAGQLESVDQAARSLGDLSTSGDFDSSVSDLDGDGGAVAEELGDVVDLSARYDIQGTLGAGGMGEVVRAVDKRLKRTVAIKRLKEEISGSRKAMQRFMTEAQAIAALNHYHIVQIHDYGRDADGPFLILEFVDGSNLAERLQQRPLEPEAAIEMTCQLCDALSMAHRKGIIHRDIKPANILLTTDERPKLTDFGLARQDDTDFTQTQTGAVIGTFDYMSPEQRRDATATDARSDLFSLGATFYQMLTGEVPRVINVDALPAGLRDIVAKILKTNPDDRYATADEFSAALREVQSSVNLFDEALSEGQCRGCGVVNETSRKFCRDCGESLREPCLGCSEEIGPWEKFCPECGADLSDLEQQQLSAITEIREQVDSFRDEQRHSDALTLLDELDQKYTHTRIVPHLTWAARVREALNAELQQLKERVADLKAQAVEAFADHQYARAIQSLDGIPEAEHNDETRTLRHDASERLEEADSLRDTIREQLNAKEYAGLLEKVDRYLELRPGNAQLIKLRPKLGSWEKRQRKRDEQQRRKEAHGESPALEDPESFSDETLTEFGDGLPNNDSRSTLPRKRKRNRKRKRSSLMAVAVGAVVVIAAVIIVASILPDGDRPQPPSDVHSVQPVKPVRTRWEHDQSLAFVKRPNDTWREEGSDGKFYSFRETENNDEYVELTGITEPNVTYRLYADRAMISRTAELSFEEKFRGGWIQPANQSADIFLAEVDDWINWRCHLQDRIVAGDEGGWRLADGVVSTSEITSHGNLWTAAEYSNFELTLDYKLSTGANSGILFRGTGESGKAGDAFLEVQLLDYAGWRKEHPTRVLPLEERNGSLWGFVAPWKPADHPADEWNSLRLLCVGPNVTLTINDAQLIDENLSEASETKPYLTSNPALSRQSGLIGFQKHTGTVEFRNVRVRDLSVSSSDSSDSDGNRRQTSAALASGGVENVAATRLLSLSDFEVMTAPKNKSVPSNTWRTVPGQNIIHGRGNGLSELISKDTFDDFVLTFDWRFSPNGKIGPNGSGVIVRSNGWNEWQLDPRGIEIDLRPQNQPGAYIGNGCLLTYGTEISVPSSRRQSPDSRHIGSVGIVPEPVPGQWAAVRIECFRDELHVYMNGRLVNEASGIGTKLGKIALRSQVTDVEFRDLRIRPYSPSAPVARKSIFNGQDLSGWSGDTQYWTVYNGELVGTSPGSLNRSQWLIYDEPLSDFELRYEFQLRHGNTGVQIRSTNWGSGGVKGHQVDMSFTDYRLLGSLMGEGIGTPRVAMTTAAQQVQLQQIADTNGWNEMVVRVVGNAVKVTFTGFSGESVTTVDEAIDGLPASGIVALQLHGGAATEVRFRNIQLQDLTQKEAATTASQVNGYTIPLPAPGDTDLLADLDINRDVWRGFCRRDGTSINVTSPDTDQDALLLLGDAPTGDYEFTIIAQRVVGSFGGMTVPVVYAGKQNWVYIAAGHTGTHGLGKEVIADMFPDHQPHRITCTVTDARVTIVSDSGARFEQSGPTRFISESKVLGVSRSQLFLKVFERFRIHAIRVRSLAKSSASTGPEDADSSPIHTFQGHTKYANHVAVSPDGRFVASASHDRTVRLWNIADGREEWRCTALTKNVLALAFSPLGNRVWVADRETIRRLDADTGQVSGEMPTPMLNGQQPTNGAMGLGCSRVIFAGEGEVGIYDTYRRQLRSMIDIRAPAVGMTEVGNSVVIGAMEGSGNVELRDVESGGLKHRFIGLRDRTMAMALSPNDKYLAVASGEHLDEQNSSENKIIIWELDNGRQISTITVNQGWQYALAFTADGQRLVSGGSGHRDDWYGHDASADGSIRVWDVQSGKLVDTYSGHTAAVLSLAMLPDGRRFVSGSADSTVKLWQLPE